MKNIFSFLFLLFPLCGGAQVLDADVLLDNVIAVMKAESPLQMDYSYTVYDGDEAVVCDKGVMKMDGKRYALVMDKMGVWCDGETQWSYMQEIDEVYITDASSDEAQNLSPLFVVENYRSGCSKNVEMKNGAAVVTLQAPSGNDIERVVLCVNMGNNRLESMNVFLQSQGRIEIILDKYQIKCKFASDAYKCPVEELGASEIVDMR